MIVLDTDHLTELQAQRARPSDSPLSQRGQRLFDRLGRVPATEVATTIVSVEEQMRGWLATIHRCSQAKGSDAIVAAYSHLGSLFIFYSSWRVLPFDRAAFEIVGTFDSKLIRRVGPMDARIAAIAVANRAILLSANLRHFRQVPGLVVEDWLSPEEGDS